MASPVKLWRYLLPNEKGQGWAEIVLTSSGFFAAVSDYGHYSFAWRCFEEGDFREFVAGLSWDYLAGKLGPCSGHQHPVDVKRTVKLIREHIVSHRREGCYTKEVAHAEWEAANRLADRDSEDGIRDWMEQTRIQDACELICYGPNWQLKTFCQQTMARLSAVLRAELAAEQEAPRG